MLHIFPKRPPLVALDFPAAIAIPVTLHFGEETNKESLCATLVDFIINYTASIDRLPWRRIAFRFVLYFIVWYSI